MAYTQLDLDALDAAIGSGALTVEYADKKVTYRSLDDMYRIRASMVAVVAPVNTTGTRRYGSYFKS